LQSVTSLLHDVKTLVVQAGNGTLSNTDRQYIATEMQGRFDELLGLANTRDGVGNYMFAGFQTATQPFSATAGGASYAGDQGTLQLQVHTARQIPVAQNGYGLFERIDSTGTGALASAAGAANTGGAQIARPTITDASQVATPPDSYSIAFSTILGVKSYIVTNTTTSTAGAAIPYVSLRRMVTHSQSSPLAIKASSRR
jgi:flagellar hook-associated protein 3 FlgL